jgi:hypothetical protein
MQHRILLETVEKDITQLDRHRLNRARLLLKSDFWTADCFLHDRQDLTPERIAELEAERARIQAALDKIGRRIQALEGQG